MPRRTRSGCSTSVALVLAALAGACSRGGAPAPTDTTTPAIPAPPAVDAGAANAPLAADPDPRLSLRRPLTAALHDGSLVVAGVAMEGRRAIVARAKPAPGGTVTRAQIVRQLD